MCDDGELAPAGTLHAGTAFITFARPGTGVSDERMGPQRFMKRGRRAMKWLVLVVAGLLLVVFAVEVVGLAQDVLSGLLSGGFAEPFAVVELIDTTILLLLVVEVFRDLLAYIADEDVLPIVVDIAIISMARKIITFRTTSYPGYADALMAAGTYTMLLFAALVAYYVVNVREP